MIDLTPTTAMLPCLLLAVGTAQSFLLAVGTAHIFLLAVGTAQLWYAAPLIVSISLVYAATRNEEMGPILGHATRFAVWIVGFMVAVMVGLQILAWLI